MLIVDQVARSGGRAAPGQFCSFQQKFFFKNYTKEEYSFQRTGQARYKVTATLGLVVHAAADGIALGAASSTSQVDIQLIVFLAIMLHKARLQLEITYERTFRLPPPSVSACFSCTRDLTRRESNDICCSSHWRRRWPHSSHTSASQGFVSSTFIYIQTLPSPL